MENTGSHSPDTPGRPGVSAVRGVVWLRSGTSAPAGLLNALSARGLRVTVVVDAAAALREVIRGEVACLVVHQPGRLARVDELLNTLERYYPHVVTRSFGGPPSSAAAGPSHPRLMRLGVTPGQDDAAEIPDEDQAQADEALAQRVTVSEAELAMLLGGFDDGDDFDDADRPGGSP